MEEEWRPVKGYEGLYEVSNMGWVRSLPRTVRKRGNKTSLYEGKLLSPIAYENGKKTGVSLSVTLCDGEKKTKRCSCTYGCNSFPSKPKPLQVRFTYRWEPVQQPSKQPNMVF